MLGARSTLVSKPSSLVHGFIIAEGFPICSGGAVLYATKVLATGTPQQMVSSLTHCVWVPDWHCAIHPGVLRTGI